VFRTLCDLPINKELLSSLKYHIFTLSLFTDLLQSLSSSWLKWLVLEQFTTTSSMSAERFRNYNKLQRPLFTLGWCALFTSRLDPVAKEEKQK